MELGMKCSEAQREWLTLREERGGGMREILIHYNIAGVTGALELQDLEKRVELSLADKDREDECWGMWVTY